MVDTELALREAEAFDALDGLLNRLRSRTFMNAWGEREGDDRGRATVVQLCTSTSQPSTNLSHQPYSEGETRWKPHNIVDLGDFGVWSLASIVYCRWKANWWRERAMPGVRYAVAAESQDGLSGYGGEHTALEDAMGDILERKWGKVRQRAEELMCTNFATRKTALSDEAPEEIVVDLRSGEEDEWDDE